MENWGGGYVVLGVDDPEDSSHKPEEGDEDSPIVLPGGRRLVGIPPEKVDAWLKDMLNKCKLIQPSYPLPRYALTKERPAS